MKVHMSLPSTCIEATKRYYSVLLGSEPVKFKHDYLKFDPKDFSLNISFHLISKNPVDASHRHLGFEVANQKEFDMVQSRLEEAKLIFRSAEESVCCYARQNKFWTRDPDGFKWEIYLLEEDVAVKSDRKSCCSTNQRDLSEKNCC